MPDNRVVVHVRLPPDIVKTLDHWAVQKDTDRARIMEAILRDWITDHKSLQEWTEYKLGA